MNHGSIKQWAKKFSTYLFLFILATSGFLVLSLTACSSNPHKAEKLENSIEKQEVITGDLSVGVKEGNLVTQRKVNMAEEVRVLQNDVYSLEDHVYGNRKYGNQGLYGVLRDCRAQLADKKNGGEGKLQWTEPMDRVTDKEDEFKIGLDEKDKIIGISEEFLKDRIERFRGYKKLLEKRQDEYEDKVAICKTELKARKYDHQDKETK
jgi:hypothetical protein